MNNPVSPPPALPRFQQLQSWRFTLALLGDYAIIAAALYAGAWTLTASPWFWISWPILWIIIATRQHALLVLMHDATHSLAYRQRWLNEFVGEVLCGGPVFYSMQSYRRNHLAHHKWMNQPKDPDWARKLKDSDERIWWDFPRKDNSLLYWPRFWLRSVVYQIKAYGEIKDNGAATTQKSSGLAKQIVRIRLASYVLLIGALTYFGFWLEFLLFWIAPALLVLTFMARIRSIAEHFALEHMDFFQGVRNVQYRHGFEHALWTPHHLGMHLVHHLYASVPFYRLNALHDTLMQDPDYAARAQTNDGIFFGRNTVAADMARRGPSAPLWRDEALAE